MAILLRLIINILNRFETVWDQFGPNRKPNRFKPIEISPNQTILNGLGLV
jgi:hypothetical protein